MYFGIPGMGNLLLNAINNADYPVIRTLTYVYSLLYIAGEISRTSATPWSIPGSFFE